MNWAGVSKVLKSGEEAILSSSVCRKTLWKSSISGRLPNRLSICRRGGEVNDNVARNGRRMAASGKKQGMNKKGALIHNREEPRRVINLRSTC